MEDFVFLGIIPGTDIQISFEMWLAIMAGLSMCLLVLVAIVRHRLLQHEQRVHKIKVQAI